MKRLFLLILIVLSFNGCSPNKSIELTKNNPSTLIGKNSKDFTVFGVKLGMTHQEAKASLGQDGRTVVEVDEYNPSRLYVYAKKDGVQKGDCILYLIWEPNSDNLQQITVFDNARDFLSMNFKRLLTLEVLDDKSEFIKKFIGYSTKKMNDKSTLIDSLRTTYIYDEIGLHVVHKKFNGAEEVVFALIK